MTAAIQELFVDILEQKISFADFSARLKSEGVERVTVDFVRREHVFYFKDGTFFAQALPTDYEFVIGETFDQEKVKNAIYQYDRSMISPYEFHVQLTAAGVLSATGFFVDQRGIYLGQNCNFYLEEWEPDYC